MVPVTIMMAWHREGEHSDSEDDDEGDGPAKGNGERLGPDRKEGGPQPWGSARAGGRKWWWRCWLW